MQVRGGSRRDLPIRHGGARRIAALLMLLGVVAAGCSGPDDEERIRELFSAAADAAQRKRAADLAALLADDYLDEAGRDKRAALQIVGVYLAQAGPIFVFTRVRDIEIEADRADARLGVAVAAAPLTRVKELDEVRADLFLVTLRLRRDGREWRIVAADWRNVGLESFLLD